MDEILIFTGKLAFSYQVKTELGRYFSQRNSIEQYLYFQREYAAVQLQLAIERLLPTK